MNTQRYLQSKRAREDQSMPRRVTRWKCEHKLAGPECSPRHYTDYEETKGEDGTFATEDECKESPCFTDAPLFLKYPAVAALMTSLLEPDTRNTILPLLDSATRDIMRRQENEIQDMKILRASIVSRGREFIPRLAEDLASPENQRAYRIASTAVENVVTSLAGIQFLQDLQNDVSDAALFIRDWLSDHELPSTPFESILYLLQPGQDPSDSTAYIADLPLVDLPPGWLDSIIEVLQEYPEDSEHVDPLVDLLIFVLLQNTQSPAPRLSSKQAFVNELMRIGQNNFPLATEYLEFQDPLVPSSRWYV